jgi:type VI secretion system protein ImpJ
LYLELCRVAGAVAVIGKSLVPPLFPAYIHNDPRRAFDEVARFIVHSVDEGVPDLFQRYAFDQEGEAFRLLPDPGWTERLAPGAKSRVVMAVQSEASDEAAVGWGVNCVIGSRSRIRSLLSRRILGLPRRPAEHVGELPARRGTVLFDVTADAEAFTPDDDLIVLGSAPGVRPTALYLYVFDAGAEQGNV